MSIAFFFLFPLFFLYASFFIFFCSALSLTTYMLCSSPLRCSLPSCGHSKCRQGLTDCENEKGRTMERKKTLRKKKYDFLLQCRQSPWSTSKTSMESMHLQYLPATSHHCTSTQQVSSYPASCLSPVTPPAIKPLVSLHTHSKITPAYNVLLLPQTDGLFLSNCLHEVFIW